MTEILDTPQVRSLLEAVIAADPGAVNPLDGTRCAYTSRDGTCHCVAGQLAADQGWQLPPGTGSTSGYAYGMRYRFGWPITLGAALFLKEVQLLADGSDGPGAAQPIPWGKIDLDAAEEAAR